MHTRETLSYCCEARAHLIRPDNPHSARQQFRGTFRCLMLHWGQPATGIRTLHRACSCSTWTALLPSLETDGAGLSLSSLLPLSLATDGAAVSLSAARADSDNCCALLSSSHVSPPAALLPAGCALESDASSFWPPRSSPRTTRVPALLAMILRVLAKDHVRTGSPSTLVRRSPT